MKDLRIRTILRRASVFILATLASIVAFAGPSIESSPDQIQRLALRTLQQVRESGEIYAWEVAGPRDRIPHPCAEECACLAKKFSSALKAERVPFATFLLRPKAGHGWIEIAGVPRGLFKTQTYAFHYITAFRFDNTWMILDPVVTGSVKLEPVTVWEKRLRTPVSFTRSAL